MRESLYYAKRDHLGLYGYNRTEEYMGEEWMLEEFGRDDELQYEYAVLLLEDHRMHFVCEVVEETLGIRFTVSEQIYLRHI